MIPVFLVAVCSFFVSCLGRDGCEPKHGKVEVDDDSDDDEDIFNYAAGEGGVQLGTVIPLEGSPDRVLFKNVDWHDWDGGKAGGWPVRRTPARLQARLPTRFPISFFCGALK